MTATPHSGKEEDFHLFLALLDSDRFVGRTRDSTRQVDTDDLMRRVVKEKLVRFDGRRDSGHDAGRCGTRSGLYRGERVTAE